MWLIYAVLYLILGIMAIVSPTLRKHQQTAQDQMDRATSMMRA